MKKFTLVLLAACALLTISCKNNRNDAAKPSQEAVDAAEAVLADDVLALVDKLSTRFVEAAGNVNFPELVSSGISDKEKLVKPDYLLDPEMTKDLLTNFQKVNALAILVTERPLRLAYDLPLAEADEVMNKLALDVNYPIDSYAGSPSDFLQKAYSTCKERGELEYFWQFSFAAMNSMIYIIAHTPDVFFRNVTEEEYASFHQQYKDCLQAVQILRKYNSSLDRAMQIYSLNSNITVPMPADNVYGTVELAKTNLVARKAVYEERRANFLK